MKNFSRYRLYLDTIRYLELVQVCYRVRRVALEQIRRIKPARLSLNEEPAVKKFTSPFPSLERCQKAQLASPVIRRAAVRSMRQMASARFRFLSHEVCFAGEPDWLYQEAGRLWRFHLHSFEYFRHLLVASIEEPEEACRLFRSLVSSWIDGNRLVQGDGWHPFTLSNRIVEWIVCACHFDSWLRKDRRFKAALLSSLAGQARFLKGNLELDVGGNHLIKNLKALVWAGSYFDGPEAGQWLRRGVDGFHEEVQKQLLGDGAHFERNPGYHAQVLRDLLETGVCLRLNAEECPGWLEDSISRMAGWLDQILQSDGELPRLKDSAPARAGEACEVLQAALIFSGKPAPCFRRSREVYPNLLFGRPGSRKAGPAGGRNPDRSSRLHPAKWLPGSGYLILRDDSRRDFMIMDAGKVCPDTLPAHTHADLFSYELTLSGTPVVVDSGVFSYNGGKWRDFFRSTRAHNTVEVAESNQSEVWDRFRVARRAHVTRTSFKETADGIFLAASHDGYRRLNPPVTHARSLFWDRPRRIWLILDRLTGRGSVEARNLVHLHPSINPEEAGEADRIWRIPVRGDSAWLAFIGCGRLSRYRGEVFPRLQGWYSPRMGVRIPAEVLSWEFSGEMPLITGYVICLEPILGVQWDNCDGTLRVRAELKAGTMEWEVARSKTSL